MGTIERKTRLKEATRSNILEAAMLIVKDEGWHALSMRRIADAIEYTAPIIYEYFTSKDDLLAELTRQGFLKLARAMKMAESKLLEPAKKLTAMWMAYWDFAFTEKEFYQLMFGVGTNCSTHPISIKEGNMISEIVIPVINQLNLDETSAECRYYAYWSAVHGLISLNLLERVGSSDLNKNVLLSALTGITAVKIVKQQ